MSDGKQDGKDWKQERLAKLRAASRPVVNRPRRRRTSADFRLTEYLTHDDDGAPVGEAAVCLKTLEAR